MISRYREELGEMLLSLTASIPRQKGGSWEEVVEVKILPGLWTALMCFCRRKGDLKGFSQYEQRWILRGAHETLSPTLERDFLEILGLDLLGMRGREFLSGPGRGAGWDLELLASVFATRLLKMESTDARTVDEMGKHKLGAGGMPGTSGIEHSLNKDSTLRLRPRGGRGGGGGRERKFHGVSTSCGLVVPGRRGKSLS